jgi:dihydrofolate synthase/folylpolyglutamate synthase
VTVSFQSLTAAYAWLDGQVNYERNLGAVQYNTRVFELEAFRRRLDALGAPQRGLHTLHIAGSRGKGSAAAALDCLLRASGLTTARFTSPHLHEYRERISLNGEMIGADAFMRLLERVAEHGVPRQPDSTAGANAFKTVFEHLTALFFLAARQHAADWAIVEVGLGGRLDATNVLDPGPVLLTRIALEHMHLLGNTLSEIAAEKAAILKTGGWAVAGTQATSPSAFSEAGLIFQQRSATMQTPLRWAEALCPLLRASASPQGLALTYEFEGEPLSLPLQLFGTYQAENLQNALALFSELRRRELVPAVPAPQLSKALQTLKIPGRMEPILETPAVMIDGAHCPAGAAALARAMDAHFGAESAVAVVAMLADKDHDAFFRALSAWPHWTELWCYEPLSPRALPAAELARHARPWFPRVRVFDSFKALLESVAANSEKHPRYIATGSLHSLDRWRMWGSEQHGSASQSLPAAAQAEQVPGH